MKGKQILFFTGILLFTLTVNLNAQSFFSRITSGQSSNKSTTPTVITSDAMDFDISKNVAVFTGNVQVDDANMRILCHQMIIRFEGKPKDISKISTGETTTTTKKDDKTADKKEDTGSKVKNIECIKNVVIIRKIPGANNKEEEQKAIAGHALYDVKTGKITLTKNPALIRGKDTLRGEVIIYWVNSERVSVRSGRHHTGELKIRSRQK